MPLKPVEIRARSGSVVDLAVMPGLPPVNRATVTFRDNSRQSILLSAEKLPMAREDVVVVCDARKAGDTKWTTVSIYVETSGDGLWTDSDGRRLLVSTMWGVKQEALKALDREILSLQGDLALSIGDGELRRTVNF